MNLDEDDVFISIDAVDEAELIDDLQHMSIERLKFLAQGVSRVINNKLYATPLYGFRHPKGKKDETDVILDVKTTSGYISTKYHKDNLWDILMLEKANYAGIEYKAVGLDYSHTHSCGEEVPATAWINAMLPQVKKPTRKEEEHSMLTENQTKSQYLNRRLEEVFYNKGDELYDTFNMRQAHPKNAKQAKEWMAAGGVVLQNAEKDDERFFSLEWQNPEKPRNETGFKAAKILMGNDYQTAKDQIVVKSPDDGLVVFEAFKARTYN